jgi:hypothetical protein
MNNGDVMKRKTWANRVLQARGWVIGSAAVLLLLSAGGLTLLAQHAREQGNVVTVLLALHLAAWSYVLGIVGLVLLPVLELIAWLRMSVKPESMRRYSPVEPGRRDLEKPVMEGPQFLQQGVASVVPSRLSRQSDDRNKATSSTKAA